jgi:hypothetical protein
MTVFDTAIDTLFNDDNLAVDAIYTPDGGGAPVSVRTIKTIEDDLTDVFSGRQVVKKIKADIRVSEVATVAAGGELLIGSTTYKVTNPQIKDSDQLIWSMELLE